MVASIWLRAAHRGVPTFLVTALLLGQSPMALAESPAQRQELVAALRQLDALERTVADSAAHAPIQPGERYHFDYPRLLADLARVRAGIQAHLTPSRAQPRDPSELAGDYRTERAAEPHAGDDCGGQAMNGAQVSAFQANSGIAPSAMATVLVGVVFAVLLVWGVWAIRTAYVGWSESRLNQRQFLGVCIRFVAMYLVLTFFLLS
jgi:RAQPRD family integrative conjugative element protein/integrating conjugative element protein (TIGR03758 family)